MVSVVQPSEQNDKLVFTFVPKPDPNHSELIVWVDLRTEHLDWNHSRDLPGDSKMEIENEIKKRLEERSKWIFRVEELAQQVENWARNAEWSTKRIPFRLDDAVIGKHSLPAVLMQKGTCRILFEPVSRSSPGADGVIDLYLMPGYDDIASIYFYGNQWNLHYLFTGTQTAATVRDEESVEWTSESLQKVLLEMQQHAEQN